MHLMKTTRFNKREQFELCLRSTTQLEHTFFWIDIWLVDQEIQNKKDGYHYLEMQATCKYDDVQKQMTIIYYGKYLQIRNVPVKQFESFEIDTSEQLFNAAFEFFNKMKGE